MQSYVGWFSRNFSRKHVRTKHAEKTCVSLWGIAFTLASSLRLGLCAEFRIQSLVRILGPQHYILGPFSSCIWGQLLTSFDRFLALSNIVQLWISLILPDHPFQHEKRTLWHYLTKCSFGIKNCRIFQDKQKPLDASFRSIFLGYIMV